MKFRHLMLALTAMTACTHSNNTQVIPPAEAEQFSAGSAEVSDGPGDEEITCMPASQSDYYDQIRRIAENLSNIAPDSDITGELERRLSQMDACFVPPQTGPMPYEGSYPSIPLPSEHEYCTLAVLTVTSQGPMYLYECSDERRDEITEQTIEDAYLAEVRRVGDDPCSDEGWSIMMIVLMGQRLGLQTMRPHPSFTDHQMRRHADIIYSMCPDREGQIPDVLLETQEPTPDTRTLGPARRKADAYHRRREIAQGIVRENLRPYDALR